MNPNQLIANDLAQYRSTKAPTGGTPDINSIDADLQAYRASKGAPATNQTPPPPVQTSSQIADQSSAQDNGASFGAVTGESPVSAGLKTLGNIPSSAWSFAKGVASSLNPINIAKNIAAIPSAFNDAVAANGGSIGDTLKNTLEAAPLETAKAVVPAFGRDLSSAAYAGVTGDNRFGSVDENLQGAQREVTNNPFGSIAPFIFAAEGGAKMADNIASKANMADYVKNIRENTINREPIPQPSTTFSDAVNKPMKAVTDVVTKPARAFGNFVADNAPKMARYGFGQMTGLEPDTISTRIANPDVDMSSISREGVASEIKNALDKRVEDLGETGRGYKTIRSQSTPINVDSSFLRDQIAKEAGVSFKDEGPGRFEGKIEATGSSAVRDSAEVAKLQKFFDFWQPYFDKGQMTSEEYLNMRKDLSDMSKFDNKPGRSGPLESTGKGIRANLNDTYRSQIKGLADADAEYSTRTTELENLRKGLLDSKGGLTKSAPNTIANSLGKGKANFVSQLEEISPGITKKVQILKMAEDFERAAGNKVGTYNRALGVGVTASVFGGGIAGLAAGIVEAVLASPSVADAILKKYSYNKALMEAVATKLRQVNNLPNSVPTKLKSTVFGRPQLTQ